MSLLLGAAAAVLLAATAAAGQTSNDPFPDPIPTDEGVITVGAVEFASLPFVDGEAARMMLLVDEPGTGRLFVNDMRGLVYNVSYDGGTVTQYLDLTDPRWGLDIEASRRERGFQSFAVHPQFGAPGTPGFGKLYTWIDTSGHGEPTGGLRAESAGDSVTHRTRSSWNGPLRNPGGAVYDGGPPRELMQNRAAVSEITTADRSASTRSRVSPVIAELRTPVRGFG